MASLQRHVDRANASLEAQVDASLSPDAVRDLSRNFPGPSFRDSDVSTGNLDRFEASEDGEHSALQRPHLIRRDHLPETPPLSRGHVGLSSGGRPSQQGESSTSCAEWGHKSPYFPGVLDSDLEPYSRCIGTTRARQRCRNRSGDSLSASRGIRSLSQRGFSRGDLTDIAIGLLCRRWHYVEADDIARRWFEQLASGPESPGSSSSGESADGRSGFWETPAPSGSRFGHSITPLTPPSLQATDEASPSKRKMKEITLNPFYLPLKPKLEENGSTLTGSFGVTPGNCKPEGLDGVRETLKDDSSNIPQLDELSRSSPKPAKVKVETSHDEAQPWAQQTEIDNAVIKREPGHKTLPNPSRQLDFARFKAENEVVQASAGPASSNAQLSVHDVGSFQILLGMDERRCVAMNKSSPKRCGNSISKPSWAEAMALVHQLAALNFNTDSAKCLAKLKVLVKLALCKGVHQGSASDKLEDWEAKLSTQYSVGIASNPRQLIPRVEEPSIPQVGAFSTTHAKSLTQTVQPAILRKMVPCNARVFDKKDTPAALRKVLLQDLTERDRKGGWIYVYWFEGGFGLVKIGLTTIGIKKRLQQWKAQCLKQPKLGFPSSSDEYIKVPNVYRVEALVHAELKDRRRKELDCPGCGKTHIEWFEEPWPHAVEVIKRWSNWMRTQPYEQVEGHGRSGRAETRTTKWQLSEHARSELDKLCTPLFRKPIVYHERSKNPSPRQPSVTARLRRSPRLLQKGVQAKTALEEGLTEFKDGSSAKINSSQSGMYLTVDLQPGRIDFHFG